MRLICGFVRIDGAPADPLHLDAMVGALARTPRAPAVARRIMGPAALAVLDFASRASAPVAPDLPAGPDGTWIACDLRFDRRPALAAALGLESSATDDALALAAFRRWDTDLPDRMDGDYAIAFWNPARRRLVCARDVMGVRPICYAHLPDRLFAFASLPKGLHASGMVQPRADAVALGRFLVEAYIRDQGTGYQGIGWLPPGHCVELTSGGPRLHRAWRPEPADVGRARLSPRDAAETLKGLIDDAVASRLPQAGPVAAHLSGGLDSSAVSVVAARHLRAQRRRLHVYSQVADPSLKLTDERPYIESVLHQEPDLVWSPVHLPSFERIDPIDEDLPVNVGLAITEDAIFAKAAGSGATILLTGVGGDEGVSYNGRALYAALLREGRWRTLPHEIRARAEQDGHPLARAVLDRLVRPLVPHWLRSARARLTGRQPDNGGAVAALRFLRPALARTVLDAISPGPTPDNGPADRIWAFAEASLAGRCTLWATFGARHGVAIACPFLDRPVVDFVLALPLERFVDGGFARQPLRNAMAGILPEPVRWRDRKLTAMPDAAIRLAPAKPWLLARIAELRRNAAVCEAFDLDAVAGALTGLPEGEEALRFARAANTDASGSLRPQIMALRAFAAAEHVARLS